MRQVIELITTIVTTVLVPLVLYYLRKNSKNESLNNALQFLDDIAHVVAEKHMKAKRDLQDPNKPGVWNEESKAFIKTSAVELSLKLLPTSAKSTLVDVYGSEDKVRELASTYIDRSVELIRNYNKKDHNEPRS